MSALSGQCGCGAVNWTTAESIIWTAICHCDDCRRAASSDYVSWLGVPRHGLEWTGPRHCFKSSDLVMRSFCQKCGTPLSFETEIFPRETHLYAATLDDKSRYKPDLHIYWSERVPWIQAWDDLPKHPKGLQDAAERGVDLWTDK